MSHAASFRFSELLLGEVAALDSPGESPAPVDRTASKVSSDAEVDREQAGLDRRHSVEVSVGATLAAEANRVLESEGAKERIRTRSLEALAQVAAELAEGEASGRTARF